jgi:predicted amidohydrolase
MTRAARLALAQYPIEAFASFEAYRAKITRWCENAARDGAQILVFPEYAAMELTSLLGAAAADLRGSLAALQPLLPEAQSLHADLARRLGVVIVMGSAPEARGERFVNAARLYAPSGAGAVQEKRVMTRFEDEQWGVSPGEGLSVFDTPFARIGVCICFDVEFPMMARALAEAGAEIILAPSCTETLRGAWRVRIGAQARALENQCYTAVAPLVGEAAWSPAVDVNVGWAGAYGPPDRGFAEDGIAALGAYTAPGWVYADLDLDAIARVRTDGAVFNFARWRDQPHAPQPIAARIAALR